VLLRRRWSCVWISSGQECVGILQGMRCTSWNGCGCSPSWNDIPDRGPDRGKHSRSDCLLFRIARFGALDGLDTQNSEEGVDSHGRRCIRQSRPQFRCTSRDGSFGVHEDSNDPRAWRLRTRLDRYRTEWGAFATKPQTFCDGQPSQLLSLSLSIRA